MVCSLKRREHFELTAFRRDLNLFYNRGETLFLDRQIAFRTKLRSGFREEQTEEMVNFRHGGNG